MIHRNRCGRVGLLGSSNRGGHWSRAVRPGPERLEDRRLLAISFAPPVFYATGQGPQGIALADLDGDSKLDLIVAETTENDVVIRPGIGDGSFGPGRRLVAGSAPVAVGTSDLNADGRLDLIVTNYLGDSLSVFLGAGDGTFAPRVNYPSGPGAASGFSVGDLDGDGHLDIAVAKPGDALVALFGGGDGTFGAAVHLTFNSFTPADVKAVDLDGDGDLDLAVATYFAAAVLINHGDGTFAPPVSYTSRGGGGNAIEAADFDGDGDLDLVQSNSNNSEVAVFPNRGDGSFEGGFIFAVEEYYGQPRGVVARDLDGDGNVDLAVARGGGLSLLVGRGDGTFDPFVRVPAAGDGVRITAGDLNGDGRLDLALTGYSSNAVSILLATPTPTLTIGDATVTEGNDGVRQATFSVKLSATSANLVSVAFATEAGTATLGDDFQPNSGVLTFNPGETTASLVVPVRGDRLYEGDEAFSVVLSGAAGAAISVDRATGRIVEDDPIPAFSVADASASEGINFVNTVITLSAPSAVPITINFVDLGDAIGDATPGVDFAQGLGSVTFSPGEMSRAVSFPILDDRLLESDESFFVIFGRATGGPSDPVVARLTIKDDEAAPVVTFALAGPVREGDGFAEIVVTRSDASAEGVIVTYGTVPGGSFGSGLAATPGEDYTDAVGQVAFRVGETRIAIRIPVLDDSTVEGNESFGVAYGIALGERPVPAIGRFLPVTILDNDPPAALVRSVEPRVVKGATRAITVSFSGAIDPTSAATATNYAVLGSGKDGRFGTRDDVRTGFRSASYDVSSNSVRLVPRGKLVGKTARRLIVTSGPTGVFDRLRRPLDGDGDGQPGGNVVIALKPGKGASGAG